jgi:hypothetical protein
MIAKVVPRGDVPRRGIAMDAHDQQLMTAVVERSELYGKEVKPLFVSTNNPLQAVLSTADAFRAQEVVLGASNKFSAEEQLDQLSFYWLHLYGGRPVPLTVRILSRDRDVNLDLAGLSREPVALPVILGAAARRAARGRRVTDSATMGFLFFHPQKPRIRIGCQRPSLKMSSVATLRVPKKESSQCLSS